MEIVKQLSFQFVEKYDVCRNDVHTKEVCTSVVVYVCVSI